ncbi:MAG: hypothetical protein MK101_00860 [Phycisphaerales bacterium]|nr:hypothetical protein [Phycisphaerales bacterium]
MTLIEVLIALALLTAVLAVAATLLLGLARDRTRIEERTDSLRSLDLALDRMDSAFATAAVRGGHLPGLVTSEDSIRLMAAIDRPGIETQVPGRHVLSLQDDGVGIVFKGLEGEGLTVPGSATLRIQARHNGAWHDKFDSGAVGALPSLVVIDAWLMADPPEDAPPDRRRVLMMPEAAPEDPERST